MTEYEKQKIKDTLRLIQRSPDRGEGWRSVSEVCWPLVCDLSPDLVDLDADNSRVRMTDKAVAVLTYA